MCPAHVRLAAGPEPNPGPYLYAPHARQPEHDVKEHRQREEGVGHIIAPPPAAAAAATIGHRRRCMFVLAKIKGDEAEITDRKGQHIEPSPWPALGEGKEGIVMA